MLVEFTVALLLTTINYSKIEIETEREMGEDREASKDTRRPPNVVCARPTCAWSTSACRSSSTKARVSATHFSTSRGSCKWEGGNNNVTHGCKAPNALLRTQLLFDQQGAN